MRPKPILPTDDTFPNDQKINFGEISEELDELLQMGVRAYRTDPQRADGLFRVALASAPQELAVYFCLYKIHAYQGNIEEARAVAERGLAEAARQAGFSADWRAWQADADMSDGAGRFALYTLKALTFIDLRRNEPALAAEKLEHLKRLDPSGAVGWPVIKALAEGIAA